MSCFSATIKGKMDLVRKLSSRCKETKKASKAHISFKKFATKAQNFKGIECFLKKLAFNLGNTPSKTEVKIISCIPIDVSDLQQKIKVLEKQLEAKSSEKKQHVNPAFCDMTFPLVCNAGVSCRGLNIDESIPQRNRVNKSNFSCLVPSMSSEEYERSIPYRDRSFLIEDVHTAPNRCRISDTYKSYDDNSRRVTTLYDTTKPFMVGDTRERLCRRQMVKKKKRYRQIKKQPRTEFVYYAQTSRGPFRSAPVHNLQSNDVNMTRSYLADMVNKQYAPKPLGSTLSDISKFSSPICRDTQEPTIPCSYDTDICSCCHGAFHNIDNTVHNQGVTRTEKVIPESNYYDSSQYDLVPVKETRKVKNASEVPKRRDPFPTMTLSPQDMRNKLRTYPLYGPLYNEGPCDIDSHCERKRRSKINKKKNIDKFIARRRKEAYKTERQIYIKPSKSCIDFGKTHVKVYTRKVTAPEYTHIQKPRKADAECNAIMKSNASDSQPTTNVTDTNDSCVSDARTEETLNQIKTILQSVLQEVKDKKTRTDAQVTQATQDMYTDKVEPHNAQGSTFLNSITYSSYNTNPYMPSCSKYLNYNPYYCTPQGMKCVQNYPLFVQSPGRHVCSSCYRNKHIRLSNTRQPMTTATNTEGNKEQAGNETEKLIKEIYNSIALNLPLGEPKSVRDSDSERKASSRKVENQPVKEVKKVATIVQTVSELFRKKNMPISSDSHNVTEESKTVTPRPIESKRVFTEVSHRSQFVATEAEYRVRRERVENVSNRSRHGRSEIQRPSQRVQVTETQHATTSSESQSSLSSSDTESDSTVVQEKHHEVTEKLPKKKNSLLSKMLKSMFKPKERQRQGQKLDRKKRREKPAANTSDSESDYQTVYSKKVEKPYVPVRPKTARRKTYSKIKQNQSPDKGYKRAPYMEQEYRREWNENLMFDDNRYRNSSMDPTGHCSEESARRPVFYQTIEARTGVVGAGRSKSRRGNPGTRRPEALRNEVIPSPAKVPPSGVNWLKKNRGKLGLRCTGEQWRQLIIEG